MYTQNIHDKYIYNLNICKSYIYICLILVYIKYYIETYIHTHTYIYKISQIQK